MSKAKALAPDQSTLMKRRSISLAEIATYENLLEALWKALKGKRHRPDVKRFLDDLDGNIGQLSQDILDAKVPYARYRHFYIHDPKLRLIHAACFEDRVLHHAIMNYAAPVFERTMVDSSYACRPLKGVHLAIKKVQHNLRRFPWYVKTDISAYFPNIDHTILFGLLQRRFKNESFLQLLWRIIDSYQAEVGKGLPIGSLTSQYFANYYLDGADRFILEHPDVKGHVRYMDDVLFWCNSRNMAKQVLLELKAFLLEQRKLIIKPTEQVNRSSYGVSYCGYRVLQGAVLLNRRKRQRYQQLRTQRELAWENGDISDLELQSAYASAHAITLHSDSEQWRKINLQIYPSSYK